MNARFFVLALTAVVFISLRSLVSASPALQGTIPPSNIYLPLIGHDGPSGAATPVPPTSTPTLTPAQTATPTITPTATATPQPVATACSCAGNLYNCPDFDTQVEAQACYEHCLAVTGKDIHGLDQGGEPGKACESLPVGWQVLSQ